VDHHAVFGGFLEEEWCRWDSTAWAVLTPQQDPGVEPCFTLWAEAKHFPLLHGNFQVFLENSTSPHEARALAGVRPSRIN